MRSPRPNSCSKIKKNKEKTIPSFYVLLKQYVTVNLRSL